MSKSNVAAPLERVTVEMPLASAVYLAKAGLAAASKDDVTPVITGVLWSASDGLVTVVSTDRYRVHRATQPLDDATFPPFLIPGKALRWLVANSSFFGRSRALLVEPVAILEFTPTEYPKLLPSSTAIAAPKGAVALTIRENSSDGADRLRYETELITGSFPPVGRLIEDALALEPSSLPDGKLNLDFLAGCRALAEDRHENATVTFVPGMGQKTGKALVVYANGVALIQKAAAA